MLRSFRQVSRPAVFLLVMQLSVVVLAAKKFGA